MNIQSKNWRIVRQIAGILTITNLKTRETQCVTAEYMPSANFLGQIPEVEFDLLCSEAFESGKWESCPGYH